MALLQSAIFKCSSYCRALNIARLSTSSLSNKQTLEEKFGLKPKPKKPLTPFLRFIASIRNELTQENPKVKPTEIFKLAANRWKEIDEGTKNELKRIYALDIQKYQENIKDYDMKISPDIRDRILLEKENIKQRKEKTRLKKRREMLGCPKKPITSFLFFLKSKASERGNMTYQEWVTKVSKDWHALTDNDKQPYVQLHNQEMTEYHKQFAKWEKDMISQGLSSVLKKP